jgi:hypothetical protein
MAAETTGQLSARLRAAAERAAGDARRNELLAADARLSELASRLAELSAEAQTAQADVDEAVQHLVGRADEDVSWEDLEAADTARRRAARLASAVEHTTLELAGASDQARRLVKEKGRR